MDGQHPHDNGRRTPESDNPNVFDDEFAIDNSPLEAEFSVADGFRPNQFQDSSPFDDTADSLTLDDRSTLRPRSSTASSDSISRSPIPSRSSTSKMHPARDPLGVQYDGSNAPVPGRISSTYSHRTTSSAPLRRVSLASTSSFATNARAHSPLPSGPSHPYGMYPQGTGLTRSASGTTSSTMRVPSRAPSGQHRPAHPYAMYPQNVFEDPEETGSPAPQPIPVGFPGMNTGYHRQIGPDGEDQGFIGLDGHTEQLPPYSRYPEQSPVLAASHTAAPQEYMELDDSGSRETLVHSSNGQVANQPNRSPSLPLSEPPSFGKSEKSWSEKTWREKRKTRFLGGRIPFWALILAFIIVIVLAILLGGVVGGFLGEEKAEAERAAASSAASVVAVYSTASMYDASTIATPTDLAPLPTYGTYALPLGDPEDTMDGCLPLPEQQCAWTCKVHGPPLRLTLDQMPGKPHQVAWLSPMAPSDGSLRYGMQSPQFGMQKLVLVEDYDDLEMGAAYHFSARYDKIVVLEPDSFTAEEAVTKRNAVSAREFEVPQDFRGRHQAQIGDLPWICVWNNTFIEGFIYVNESTAATISSSSSAAAATASSGYTTTLATSLQPGLTSSSIPLAASSPTPTSSNGIAAMMSGYSFYRSGPFSALPTDLPISLPAMERRGEYPPLFPRVVKIEERRLPGNHDAPYCQQWRVLDDGRVVPNADNGKPIIVELVEEDPVYPEGTDDEGQAAATSGVSEKRRAPLGRRHDPPSACHCQWSST